MNDKTGNGLGQQDDMIEIDPLMSRVLAYAIRSGQVSASTIQRRFSIGYARAARIIDGLEAHGFIGPSTGNMKPRETLMTAEQYKEVFKYDIDDSDYDEQVEKQEPVSAKRIENHVNDSDMDPLTSRVMAYAIKTKQISTSTIQRRFAIGYARAARIIDDMEDRGFIGPSTGSYKPRDILMTEEEFKKVFGPSDDE